VDELLPRDVVSRAIMSKMLEEGSDHVYLDCRGLDHFSTRFPSLAALLDSVGLDASTDLLPVAPAAHHMCGGVLTDLDGATSVPGLWAAGEVACAGVHGANRLASNSLLEGMVFAPRAVEAIVGGKTECDRSGAMTAMIGLEGHARTGPGPEGDLDIRGELVQVPPVSLGDQLPQSDAGRSGGDAVNNGGSRTGSSNPEETRARLSETMMNNAGVVRSGESLTVALEVIDELAGSIGPVGSATIGLAELDNLVQLSRDVVVSALNRCESRGTHHRDDFPETVDSQRRRIVHVGTRGRLGRD
jgi:L-aspartate oxidase